MTVNIEWLERVAEPSSAEEWMPVIRKTRASGTAPRTRGPRGKVVTSWAGKPNRRRLTPEDLRCAWCDDVAAWEHSGVFLCGHRGCSVAAGVDGEPMRRLWV